MRHATVNAHARANPATLAFGCVPWDCLAGIA